jgi:hypothetical protein
MAQGLLILALVLTVVLALTFLLLRPLNFPMPNAKNTAKSPWLFTDF